MASKDFEDGVWRTIGGRRIFIRDGESLSSAMKKSGKFKRLKDIEHQQRKINNELAGLTGRDKEQADEEYDAYEELKKGDRIEEDRKSEKMSHSEMSKRVSDNQELADKIIANEEYNDITTNYYGGTDAVIKNERTGKSVKITPSDTEESLRKKIDDSYKKYANDVKSKTMDQYIEDHNEKVSKEKYNTDRDKNYRDYMDGKKSSEEYFRDAQKSKDSYYGKAESNLERYEKEAAAVKSQVSDIEQATGSKVKNAFETDLYGNGKETRFMIDDNKWIAHTKESFGQKEDTWSVNELKNGNIESKSYKSYDDMIKNIGRSKSDESDKYSNYYKKEGLGEPSNYKKGDEIEFNSGYYNTLKGTIVREATDEEKRYQINSNLKGYIVRDNLGHDHVVADTRIKKQGETNKAYKSAYEDYKKKHPNTKLSFGQFVDMSEGK